MPSDQTCEIQAKLFNYIHTKAACDHVDDTMLATAAWVRRRQAKSTSCVLLETHTQSEAADSHRGTQSTQSNKKKKKKKR